MTISTTETLASAVLCMAERQAKSCRIRRGAAERFLRVANATRRQVASVCLSVRSVTSVTLIVGQKVRGNRESHTSSERGSVTCATAVPGTGRTGHVLRMIELDVETLFEVIGKCLTGRVITVHTGMTDRAEWCACRMDLCLVAVKAVPVARQSRPRGIIASTMTTCTRGRCVTRAAVQEF